MRKILNKLVKPADFNIAIVTKVISDWAAPLKKLSPLASILFILLNIRTLFQKRSTVITLLVLVPLLIMTRRPEVLRVIFSIALFWIFLEKFSSGLGKMNQWVAIGLCVYTLVIFAGIFHPGYYLMMYDGSLRYKFMLESHNALSIVVFMIFIYLCETLLMVLRTPPGSPAAFGSGRPLKVLLFIAMMALILIFLSIKSRLYIGLSFSYITIVAFSRWRRMRVLAFIPAVYIGTFILLTLLSNRLTIRMDAQDLVELRREMLTRDSLSTSDSSYLANNAGLASAMLTNKRLLNFSSTGRDKLIRAFTVTLQYVGWQKFIYSNNVENYMTVKRHVPNINLASSSLTENAYLTVVLSAGFVGLALLLYMAGVYITHFLRRRELLSLTFFLLLLAVWFFEETTIFTFSLIAHLFALASINRIEKEDYESSAGN